jgi:hypothetical protein
VLETSCKNDIVFHGCIIAHKEEDGNLFPIGHNDINIEKDSFQQFEGTIKFEL